MKIKFYPDDIESDVIEVPDDISEDELNDMTSKVMAIDPHAFVNVTQSMAVKGNFYQKPL
jgi:hypothetical protein